MKPSDFMDVVDKVCEVHNAYLDNLRQQITDEINWVYQNENEPIELRRYAFKIYDRNLVPFLTDEQVHSLIEIRVNELYDHLCGINNGKTNTLPIKAIVQELKLFGR